MNQEESKEWAEILAPYAEAAAEGAATFDEADAIVQKLIDAIGREAEAGGWYSEWETLMGWDD